MLGSSQRLSLRQESQPLMQPWAQLQPGPPAAPPLFRQEGVSKSLSMSGRTRPSQVVSLHAILEGAIGSVPPGREGEYLRCRIHKRLRKAASQGLIRDRAGTQWSWQADDKDVGVVRRLVSEVVGPGRRAANSNTTGASLATTSVGAFARAPIERSNPSQLTREVEGSSSVRRDFWRSSLGPHVAEPTVPRLAGPARSRALWLGAAAAKGGEGGDIGRDASNGVGGMNVQKSCSASLAPSSTAVASAGSTSAVVIASDVSVSATVPAVVSMPAAISASGRGNGSGCETGPSNNGGGGIQQRALAEESGSCSDGVSSGNRLPSTDAPMALDSANVIGASPRGGVVTRPLVHSGNGCGDCARVGGAFEGNVTTTVRGIGEGNITCPKEAVASCNVVHRSDIGGDTQTTELRPTQAVVVDRGFEAEGEDGATATAKTNGYGTGCDSGGKAAVVEAATIASGTNIAADVSHGVCGTSETLASDSRRSNRAGDTVVTSGPRRRRRRGRPSEVGNGGDRKGEGGPTGTVQGYDSGGSVAGCGAPSIAANLLSAVAKKKRMRRPGRAGIAPRKLKGMKRKWLQTELAKAEDALHSEWKALPRDAVTQELLAWRYRDLGHAKGKSGDHGRMDPLRETLDGLISQRRADACMVATLGEGGGFGKDFVDDGNASACSSRLGVGVDGEGDMPLLERTEVAVARLPHPALVFLEHDQKMASALVSARRPLVAHAATAKSDAAVGVAGKTVPPPMPSGSATKVPTGTSQTVPSISGGIMSAGGSNIQKDGPITNGEAQRPSPSGSGAMVVDASVAEALIAEALERYLRLNATDRAALWSVVHSRSWRQELAVVNALAAHGFTPIANESVVDKHRSGFDAFLTERAMWHQRSRLVEQPSVAGATEPPLQSNDDVGVVEDDPAWILETEAAFLHLPRSEKAWWLERARDDALGEWAANWAPSCELDPEG
eukprot:TRINITY_DN39992_c0_g1_i1.p1 TRINITY_DN39992_c0_g1~~TRINITY_DN39992_c0_g1_i1.p1  ORF type:complete len:954 (-),score=159.81 TRINITY_DN39992_c0_g1_i1:32-2893(-)